LTIEFTRTHQEHTLNARASYVVLSAFWCLSPLD
jgi:hypothetical protein